MSGSALIAIVVFLASVVLSQKIAVNAGSRLDNEMKLKLMEVFPKRNVIYTVIVFGMMIAFFGAVYIFPQFVKLITLMYGITFTIYLFAKWYLNIRKLREISAPEFYIRSVMISFAVFICGAVAAAIVFSIGSSIEK